MLLHIQDQNKEKGGKKNTSGTWQKQSILVRDFHCSISIFSFGTMTHGVNLKLNVQISWDEMIFYS